MYFKILENFSRVNIHLDLSYAYDILLNVHNSIRKAGIDMNNIELSGQMLGIVESLVTTYNRDKRKFNRKEKKNMLDGITMALSGSIILMTELDRNRVIEMLHRNRLDRQISKSIKRLKRNNKDVFLHEQVKG